MEREHPPHSRTARALSDVGYQSSLSRRGGPGSAQPDYENGALDPEKAKFLLMDKEWSEDIEQLYLQHIHSI